MTEKTTKLKWTPELTERAVEGYKTSDKSREAVEALGVELGGFNFKQMVGKLSHEKVYEAPVKEVKGVKDEGPTKAQILTAIQEGADFDVEGFDGATKDALKRLAGVLNIELPEVKASA